MTPTQSSPRLDGAFDAFLFAAVGEDASGMPLSVLSALSRLDIDPWADADRLSRLPKDSAIVALGQSIALLPPGAWLASDATAIATRLVELLPKPGATLKATPQAFTKLPADWKRWTTWVLAIAVVGVAGYLLIGALTAVEHRSATGDSGRSYLLPTQ